MSNRDEWLDELDKLVYERVYGMSWTDMPGWLEEYMPTRDWEAAGVLLDKLSKENHIVSMETSGGDWDVIVMGDDMDDMVWESADSGPLAIVLAALKRYNVEIPEKPEGEEE